MRVTFAFDCQLNDNEDYMKEGQQVEVYKHPIKKEDCIPVIIEKAFDYEGNEIRFNEYIWFMKSAFKEEM